MGSEFVLFVSAAIFSIGAVGFVIRKNPLVMFMSVELMLNAVNFLLVGYSSFLKSLDGQIFALIIMTVAAAEVVKNGVSKQPDNIEVAELAAWTSVARVILNLHESITRY